MKKLLKSEVCGSVNSAPKKKLKHGAWKRRLQNVVSKRAISQNKDSSLSPKEHPYSLKIKAHFYFFKSKGGFSFNLVQDQANAPNFKSNTFNHTSNLETSRHNLKSSFIVPSDRKVSQRSNQRSSLYSFIIKSYTKDCTHIYTNEHKLIICYTILWLYDLSFTKFYVYILPTAFVLQPLVWELRLRIHLTAFILQPSVWELHPHIVPTAFALRPSAWELCLHIIPTAFALRSSVCELCLHIVPTAFVLRPSIWELHLRILPMPSSCGYQRSSSKLWHTEACDFRYPDFISFDNLYYIEHVLKL